MVATWPVRQMGRWWGRKVTSWLLVTALILSLIVFKPAGQRGSQDALAAGLDRRQQQQGGVDSGRLGSTSGCGRLFRLSDSRLHWESAADWPSGCRSSTAGPAAVRRRLHLRRTQTGRRARLVFIGDSRARILFEKLRETLGLRLEGRLLRDLLPSLFAANVTIKAHGDPDRCTAGHLMRFIAAANVQLVACDMLASGPLLDASFFWYTHLDAGFRDRLSQLAAECDRGAACPDLVVMTAGMWYAKLISKETPLQERVMRFRRDAAALAARLQPLARHTRVLYRLDGPEQSETDGVRSHIGGALSVINAAAWEVVSQVPGAQVWTSNLPDSLRFYHTVCLELRKHQVLHISPVRHGCLDSNHVGDVVRANAVHQLLSFICRDQHQLRPGHCCGRDAEQRNEAEGQTKSLSARHSALLL